MNRYYRTQTGNGFTLIELLLYVSVSATLLLTMSAFLITMLQSRVKNQTIAEVEQQGMQVMQLISQTLRNAESVTAPTIGNNSASLTLDVVDVASDPTIFDLSSGVVRITEGTGSAIALTNSHITVSNLTFTNFSHADTPGIVQIGFTIAHVNPIGRNEYDFSKTFQTSASLRYPQ